MDKLNVKAAVIPNKTGVLRGVRPVPFVGEVGRFRP